MLNACCGITRYMMLAENRQVTDNRTLGEIFYLMSDELSDITWIEAFHMIIQIFMETLSDKLSLTSEQLDKLMDSFLLALPKQFKGSLGLCA